MAARTLDVPEQQVALDFPDDGDYTWHARIRMIGSRTGRWFFRTPDRGPEFDDIVTHRKVALPQVGSFPSTGARLHPCPSTPIPPGLA